MPIKIKSNSGSVTLDAHDVSGDQTLTVPSLSGGKTLLTTDGDGSSLTGVGVDGITSASSSGTAINILSNNAVLIGASNPTAQTYAGSLEVESKTGTDNGLVLWTSTSSGNQGMAFFRFNTSTTVGYIAAYPASCGYFTSPTAGMKGTDANTIAFITSDATRMSINNAGQVDFSPFSASGATEGLNINEVGKIITSANSTASRSRFGFYNPNGNVGNIATSGSSTSYSTSSDYRLKENLVPLTDSIERVKSLKPYRFNFIADPDVIVDGFVAHEAGEVVPECCSGEKDAMKMEEYEITPAVEEVRDAEGNIITEAVDAIMGEREIMDPQGIDQSKLVPVMCSAIQELITMNENLIARIEALENN